MTHISMMASSINTKHLLKTGPVCLKSSYHDLLLCRTCHSTDHDHCQYSLCL